MTRRSIPGRRTKGRVLLGFLLAPVAPGLLLGSVFTIPAVLMMLTAKEHSGFWFILRIAAVTMAVGILPSAVIGYSIVLVLAVPLYLSRHTLRLRGRFSYIAVGAALGAIVPVILLTVRIHPVGRVEQLLFFTMCGGFAGGVFHLVARPDLSTCKAN